jgi:hypothetical protein
MRRWLLLMMAIVGLGCVRAPMEPLTQVDAEVREPVVAEVPEVAPTPEVEPPPPPLLVLVDEDWVWDDGDPSGPLLRLVELESADEDDPAAIRALLGVLGPMMECYERALGRTPGLALTLSIRRTPPSETDAVGLSITENTPEPSGIPACAAPILARALPPHAHDPHGRYALRFFPRRDQAHALPQPDLDDVVIEREGGSCFTRRTYPCKPHKMCKAADWERTRCKHPADRPGVELRWVFGPATPAGQWPRIGIDLVGADDGLVWRAELDPEDAQRLGPLHADAARRHLAEFRSELAPDVFGVILEPTRVVVADRAGVRTHDRHTGKRGFRYAAPPPAGPPFFFDHGQLRIRGAKWHCIGGARRGAFTASCGDVRLWFDGYTLAVLDRESMSLRSETTIVADTTTRSGDAANPKISLQVEGWKVGVEGRVFLQ